MTFALKATFEPHVQSHSYEVRMSNSRGVPYFYNTETQQSTWDPPAGLSDEEVKGLPGASQYLGGGGGAGAGGGNGKVRASHLLVKHRDSRRPSSWREVSAVTSILFLNKAGC